MRRREFITVLGGAAAWPLAGRAQQSKNVPLIGVLYQGESAERQPDHTWLREGFRAVGYVAGINVILEERYFANNPEEADLLAKELVDLKCDLLIGVTVTAALALRRRTSTIPIVFIYNSRPVASGLVASLNHPGGNVTGVTHVGIDTAAKRVELLRDTISGLSSVALIWDPYPAILFINRAELEDTRKAANQLGLSFERSNAAVQSVLKKQFQRPVGLAQLYLVTIIGMPSKQNALRN